MACGKTTLGTALARSAGVDFIDLDNEVEQVAGCSIPLIFSRDGEQAFRRLEADTLVRCIAQARELPGTVVIGCGGGTPCQDANLAMMLKAGTVVWLKASRERSVARLLEAVAEGSRPLMAGLDAHGIAARIDSDMAIREKFYSRAHHIFDSSYLDTPEEIEESVKNFTALFLKNSEH